MYNMIAGAEDNDQYDQFTSYYFAIIFFLLINMTLYTHSPSTSTVGDSTWRIITRV